MTCLRLNVLLLHLTLFVMSPAKVDAGGNNPTEWAGGSLRETTACVSFDLPWVQEAVDQGPSNPWGLYSPECDTNNCPGGCCRAYTNVLHCDTTNDLSHLAVRNWSSKNVSALLFFCQPSSHPFTFSLLLYMKH